MEVKATVTLEKARTLIAKLDDWLCAPSGRRCSPKQIEEFLEEIVILPQGGFRFQIVSLTWLITVSRRGWKEGPVISPTRALDRLW